MTTNWHDHIQRYISGTITEAETKALERQLKTDAALRDWYLDALNLDSALEAAAESAQRALSLPVPFSQRVLTLASSHRFRWLSWRPLSAAAAAAAAVVLYTWVTDRFPLTEQRHFRMVTATNARWTDPNVELALTSGMAIEGSVRLDSGRADFEMADGAVLVVRGPASVRFASRKVVFVDEGRVYCHCPTPESRISIITPQTEVVDLGTEFTVEARLDASTHVAVLSGSVDVKAPNAGVLKAGTAVDVNANGVVHLAPLTSEQIAALAKNAAYPQVTAGQSLPNRLNESGFEVSLPSAIWRGADECLEHAVGRGRSGNAVRIRGKKHKLWPLVKQNVPVGDIAGKVVVAEAWATTPADDPLSKRQQAGLKLAFLNAEGREFASSVRHFMAEHPQPGAYVRAELAALAPEGTVAVELQLMMISCGLNSGSLIFDDASLRVGTGSAD